MRAQGRFGDASLLIVPALLLLALTFAAPLVWFFYGALTESRGLPRCWTCSAASRPPGR